jgi:hypothetical protein
MDSVRNHSRQYWSGVSVSFVPLLITCMLSPIDITQWCICCVFSRQSSKTELLDEMVKCSQIEKKTRKETIVEWVLCRHSTKIRMYRDMNSGSPEHNAIPPRYRLHNFMWGLLFGSEGPSGSCVNICERLLSHL